MTTRVYYAPPLPWGIIGQWLAYRISCGSDDILSGDPSVVHPCCPGCQAGGAPPLPAVYGPSPRQRQSTRPTTVSDGMRYAVERGTAHPLLVADSIARAGSIRVLDTTPVCWATPSLPLLPPWPPPAARAPPNCGCRCAPWTAGLRSAVLATAVALRHRHQTVGTRRWAGVFPPAQCLAAGGSGGALEGRHSPGVPPRRPLRR